MSLTSHPATPTDWTQVARLVDHAILHPTTTTAQMRAELEAIKAWPIASVCIKPAAVALCAEILAGTDVATGTVIGFPHGTPRPDVKALEAERAFDDGAGEVDMVVNTGAAIGGDWAFVREDVKAVLDVARDRGGLLKVIFETDHVTDDATKIRLCEVCTELGVDYVKTSTGFGFVKGDDGRYGYVGATEHDLVLMRKHSGPKVGVKASGGVRSLDDALMCVRVGCTRIGMSATLAVCREAHAKLGGPPLPGGAGGDGSAGY